MLFSNSFCWSGRLFHLFNLRALALVLNPLRLRRTDLDYIDRAAYQGRFGRGFSHDPFVDISYFIEIAEEILFLHDGVDAVLHSKEEDLRLPGAGLRHYVLLDRLELDRFLFLANDPVLQHGEDRSIILFGARDQDLHGYAVLDIFRVPSGEKLVVSFAQFFESSFELPLNSLVEGVEAGSDCSRAGKTLLSDLVGIEAGFRKSGYPREREVDIVHLRYLALADRNILFDQDLAVGADENIIAGLYCNYAGSESCR